MYRQRWRPDREALAAVRDDQIPEYISRCGLCDGAGEYDQSYTAGCGMGRYHTLGPCHHCGGSYGIRGSGFVYDETGKAVGDSVLAQLETIGRRNLTEPRP